MMPKLPLKVHVLQTTDRPLLLYTWLLDNENNVALYKVFDVVSVVLPNPRPRE